MNPSGKAPTPRGEKEEEEEHFSYAIQLVTSASVPMVLLAAFRLDVFEIISNAGTDVQLSASEIAGRMSTENPDSGVMLDRMLRLLASHSILTCSNRRDISSSNQIERVYGLAPVAKWFIRNPNFNGASLGPLLALHQDKVFGDSWYELEGAIKEGGIPFNRVHDGVHAFEYPRKDERFNEVFNKGMMNHTIIAITRILQSYNGFEKLQTLVDVGGGLGVTISIITSKYPNIINALNFDLPHVIQHAPPYPGVQHIGGDMFESVPKGDAIFMKWILHDWDDEHCLKLLKNCYKSLPDGGKVIVAEALLEMPSEPEHDSEPKPKPRGISTSIPASVKATCQYDMLMFAQNPGGKERSRLEFQSLATSAGFKGMNLQCFVCNLWIMEFYK